MPAWQIGFQVGRILFGVELFQTDLFFLFLPAVCITSLVVGGLEQHKLSAAGGQAKCQVCQEPLSASQLSGVVSKRGHAKLEMTSQIFSWA